MKTHFLEIPLEFVHEDERYPNRDKRQIYEHLKYLFSRPRKYPLPAIDVDFVDDKLVVTAGHNYLRLARELGEPWIRAVYRSECASSGEVLSGLPPGIRVTPREVFERELASKVEREFHVYFFERPLSAEGQQRFLSDIAGFFERLETPLIPRTERRLFQWSFPFEGRCGEFEALIPVGDPSWMRAYLETSRSFSCNVERIISFQGARFPER